MKKTLRLRSDYLAELSQADLEIVVGGAATYECTFPKCPTIDYCNPLPTTPVRECLKN